MSHIHRRNFRAQHTSSALFSLALLVSLGLSMLWLAPVQARQATPPPPSPTGLSDPHEVEAFLDGVLSAQLADDHIAGATVSVVKDGRLFFARGYGDADVQADKPVSAQTTLFRVGSVSKLFTATAVMQLVEQGKLNLHADVNTYLRISQISGIYWWTRRSYTTYEKLTLLGSTASVTDVGNGRVLISLGGQPLWAFVEVAPWVFQQVDGPRTVVFRPDPTGMTMLISSVPMMAFNKMAWYDDPTFHFVLIGACVLLFLSVLLLWPLGFVRRVMRPGARRKKAALEGTQTSPPDEQGKPPLKRWGIFPLLTSWLAGVLCLLNVLFLIGLVPILSNPMSVLFGVPPLLTTLFTLALVCAFLTVGSVVGALLAWWGRFWSVGRRVHYSLVALAALAFTWELLYWNLLGFRV